MNKLLPPLFFLLIFQPAASAQQWDWVKSFPISTGNFTGLALSHDGYLYASGSLQDTLWLDLDTLVSPGQSWWLYGSFLAKFDTAGTLIWSKFLGTDYGFWQITEGADHRLYLGGGLRSDTVTIGSSVHVRARGEMLLAQMTPDGNFNWTLNFADPNPPGTNVVSLGKFSLDADNNLYICGTFDQTGYFGSDTLHAVDGTIYISKVDAAGSFIWTAQAGCNEPWEFLRASSCHVDPDGNIYVVGRTSDNMHFGPHTFVTPQGRKNGFLARYDQQGNCLWVSQIGPNTPYQPIQIIPTTQPVDVITDQSGDVIITGFMEEGSYFDTIYVPIQPNVQRGSFFLAKYNAEGHALWLRRAEPGSYSYSGESLLLQESGRLLVTGGFRDALSLGAGQVSTTYLSGVNAQDKFIAEFTSAGAFNWLANANAYLSGFYLTLDVCGNGRVFMASAYDYYPAVFGGLNLPVPDHRQLLLARFSFQSACPGTSGVTAVPTFGQLHFFPNPTAGTLQLDFPEAGPLQLVLRDAYGRLVHREWLADSPASVVLPGGLVNGVYWLEVGDGGGKVVEREQVLLVR